MKLDLKNLLLLCCILLAGACSSNQKSKSPESEEQKPPNIIVIMADDAGYIDFGFMGSEDLETPRLDQLSKSGVLFTDAHVSATVCAPSRAGFITGKYQQRFGFEANGTHGIGLADDVLTLADVLKKKNYKTAVLGKWHLGEADDDHPNQRGFDEFYGFIGGSRSYFPMDNPSKISMLQHNGQRVVFEGYMTDVLGDKAVAYIKEDRNEPLFMFVSFNAVHTPMQAKKEHLEKYKNHPRQKLAAMTWSLDENVGKIVQSLKETEQYDNTLIFFVSDNGGAYSNTSKNGPLKGAKGNKFEGGHRVPFIVHWPKEIEGGKVFNGLTSSLDIFATSIKAAGMNPDPNLELDGVDLLPYLTNEKTGHPHQQLFWRKLNEAGVRIGNQKLIRLKDFGSVMYDLKEDLGETTDLSKSATQEFEKMTRALETWETGLIDPLWDEGNWMPVTYHIHEQLMQNKPVLYRSPGARKKYLENNKPE